MSSVSESSLLSSILLANELIASHLEGPFRQAGLNFGSFELLAAVRGGKGSISQAELARRLGITPASLCEAVQIAVGKGLVEQTAHRTDARVRVVRLTSKGSRSLDSALKAFQSLESHVASQLSKTRQTAAEAALGAIIEILDESQDA